MPPSRSGSPGPNGCESEPRPTRREAAPPPRRASARWRSAGTVTLRFTGSPGMGWTGIVQASSSAASSVNRVGPSDGKRRERPSQERSSRALGRLRRDEVRAVHGRARSDRPATRFRVSADRDDGDRCTVRRRGDRDRGDEGRGHQWSSAIVDEDDGVDPRRGAAGRRSSRPAPRASRAPGTRPRRTRPDAPRRERRRRPCRRRGGPPPPRARTPRRGRSARPPGRRRGRPGCARAAAARRARRRACPDRPSGPSCPRRRRSHRRRAPHQLAPSEPATGIWKRHPLSEVQGRAP